MFDELIPPMRDELLKPRDSLAAGVPNAGGHWRGAPKGVPDPGWRRPGNPFQDLVRSATIAGPIDRRHVKRIENLDRDYRQLCATALEPEYEHTWDTDGYVDPTLAAQELATRILESNEGLIAELDEFSAYLSLRIRGFWRARRLNRRIRAWVQTLRGFR